MYMYLEIIQSSARPSTMTTEEDVDVQSAHIMSNVSLSLSPRLKPELGYSYQVGVLLSYMEQGVVLPEWSPYRFFHL